MAPSDSKDNTYVSRDWFTPPGVHHSRNISTILEQRIRTHNNKGKTEGNQNYSDVNSRSPHTDGDSPGALHATVNLGIFALNTRFHDTRMTEDDDRRGTNEPEEGSERGSPKEEWNADHKKTGIEGRLCNGAVAKLERVRACKVVRCQYVTHERRSGRNN